MKQIKLPEALQLGKETNIFGKAKLKELNFIIDNFIMVPGTFILQFQMYKDHRYGRAIFHHFFTTVKVYPLKLE